MQPEAAALTWLPWLDLPAAGPLITITEKALNTRRVNACEAAEIAWPGNALRRSFAHLAAFEDAARTAEILGHTDAETTKSKYRIARKKEVKEVAEAWFAITPGTVLGPAPWR